MRVALRKGNDVRHVRTPEALEHFLAEGYEECEQQPLQEDANNPVVIVKGNEQRKVKAKAVEYFLERGWEREDGRAQENADAKIAKGEKRSAQKQASKRKLSKAEKKVAKPKPAPKKKAKGKVKQEDRNTRLAELLGPLPERDDEGTKQIVSIVAKGFDVEKFAQLLQDWNVSSLTELPVGDRAEFLLELQKAK